MTQNANRNWAAGAGLILLLVAIMLSFGPPPPKTSWATAGQTQTAAAQATATQGTVETQTAVAIASFTAVPSNTPVASTPTIAVIPTQVGAKGVIPEPVRFGAWKYGTATVQFGACSSGTMNSTITVPGLQAGDFIRFNAANDASGVVPLNVVVVTNNTVKILAQGCGSTDNIKVVLPYFWWDRTYPDASKNAGDPGPIL